MKLATLQTSRGTELALVVSDVPVPIEDLAKEWGISVDKSLLRTMNQLLRSPHGLDSLFALYSQVENYRPGRGSYGTLLSPVPDPGKVICVGLNYRTHIQEAGLTEPKFPVLFSKFSNAVASHDQVVTIPQTVTQLDYEAELVIVMGKHCYQVDQTHALDYVLGYTCGNDLSARDLQFRTPQWLLGKSLEGFAPMGPYLVTADSIDPDHVSISCKVNGEQRQLDNTANLLFSCRYLVSYISRYMALEPGDVIFTGTPQGTIMGLPPDQQKWLTAGDVVTVEVEGIGALRTPLGPAHSV